MMTPVNIPMATLNTLLAHQFTDCLRGIPLVPLDPPVEEALASIGGIVCPGEVATPAKVAEVIATQYPTRWRLWRFSLKSSPVRRLYPAAGSMVRGAKALQEWVNNTFLPGTPAHVWLEATLSMGAILQMIAEARPHRQTPRTPPANRKVSREELLAALQEHPHNRSAAARRLGISRQAVDARIEAGRDDPKLGVFWHPPRRYTHRAILPSTPTHSLV